MAKIVDTTSKLEEMYYKERNRYYFWLLVVFLSVVMVFRSNGLTIISFLISAIVASYHGIKKRIYYAGISGEKHTLGILNKLPDTYTILVDINLNDVNQIDYLVIGPTGLFVVEVKNHMGRIEGCSMDDTWSQYKIGKKGNTYQNQINNPVKQVNRQVYYLSQLLRKNHVFAWVQGIVFFSNNNTCVNINTMETVPIFNMRDNNGLDLLKYIRTYSNSKVTRQEIPKIIELLG